MEKYYCLKYFLALIILIGIGSVCNDSNNNQKQTSKENNTSLNSSDTIQKDWYKDLVVSKITKPSKIDEATKDKSKTNEQLHLSIVLSKVETNKVKEISYFYKQYYKSRAKELQNKLTMWVDFYDKKLSKEILEDIDGLHTTKQQEEEWDKHFKANYIYNYDNNYEEFPNLPK